MMTSRSSVESPCVKWVQIRMWKEHLLPPRFHLIQWESLSLCVMKAEEDKTRCKTTLFEILYEDDCIGCLNKCIIMCIFYGHDGGWTAKKKRMKDDVNKPCATLVCQIICRWVM